MDPTQKPQVTPGQNTASQNPNKKKILIVEDDFFIRDLYEIEARRAGYDVITAADGQEGVDTAKKVMPDLLLIDLMLPKMDGISIIKTLKALPEFANIPCLIITNLEDSTKEEEAKAAGAAAYMLKIRFTPEAVIQAIQTHLS